VCGMAENVVWYKCPICGLMSQGQENQPNWCDECEVPMVRA